jgi:hypothetical protein
MKNTTYKIITSIIACFMFVSAFPQNNVMYQMRKLPQASELNPAFQPDDAFYIYLPAISSIGLGVVNTGFTIDELNGERSLNKIASDILDDKNLLGIDFGTTIFGFGFEVGDNFFFNYATSFKFSNELEYPSDLIGFASGNYDYDNLKGKTISLSEMNMEAFSYIENSFGFSYRINKNLVVGTNIKYLIGVGNAKFDLKKANIETDNDLNHMKIDAEAHLKVYGFPTTLKNGDEGSLEDFEIEADDDNFETSDVTGNTGFGIDFGATYDNFFIENLQISASITDLGYISWKNNAREITFKSNYTFKGADINDLVDDDSDSDIFDSDEFNKESRYNSKSAGDASTTLRPKIHLGASYKLFSWVEFNALSRTIISEIDTRTSFTLASTVYAGNILGLTGAYSIMNGSFSNIGVGLDLKLGGLQIYMLTDNILGSTMPHMSKTANIRLGINLSIGDHLSNRNRTKDEKRNWILEVYDDEDDVIPEELRAEANIEDTNSEGTTTERTELTPEEIKELEEKDNSIPEEKKEQLEQDKKKFEETFDKETKEESNQN